MRLLLLLLPLLLLASPSLAQQPQNDDAAVLKAIKDGKHVQIKHKGRESTAQGVGGESSGEKATLDIDGKPSLVSLDNIGRAQGGGGKAVGFAETVTHSLAWRLGAGILGALALASSWLLFAKAIPDIKGGLVVAGQGLLMLIGAIFYPDLVVLALMAFWAVMLGTYLFKHFAGARAVALVEAAKATVQGALDTAISAVGSAGKAVSDAWHAEVAKVIEPAERPIINDTAIKQEAFSVRV